MKSNLWRSEHPRGRQCSYAAPVKRVRALSEHIGGHALGVGTTYRPNFRRVTNVAAFGAFVDIGVHQDGLVHISALSHTFVKDPHTVVKAGQVVKVKVLEVDVKRQRIALTMRLTDAAPQAGSKPEQRGDRNDAKRLNQHRAQTQNAPAGNAMAAAFAKLRG